MRVNDRFVPPRASPVLTGSQKLLILRFRTFVARYRLVVDFVSTKSPEFILNVLDFALDFLGVS